MEDSLEGELKHPERLCAAVVQVIEELEEATIISTERANELRSQVYRSFDQPEEQE